MELVDVKCPFKYISKSDNKEYECNRICVKVTPGSSGEAWCRRCAKVFEFVISKQVQVQQLAEAR